MTHQSRKNPNARTTVVVDTSPKVTIDPLAYFEVAMKQYVALVNQGQSLEQAMCNTIDYMNETYTVQEDSND